ncbi:hypothetical protein IQ07DRAFT_638703 [Pyrenochaeta sp. DS3sAY3a]|nr:hypothetical protein IQ07DRAFT_638703 [Pyrenochaeta sp. DS3sAY3a]
MSNGHYQEPKDMAGEGSHQTEVPIDPRLLAPVQEWNQQCQPTEQLDNHAAESSPISFGDPDMGVNSRPAGNTSVPQPTYHPLGISSTYLPPTSSAGVSNLGNIFNPTAPAFVQNAQTFYQPAPTFGQAAPSTAQIAPAYGQNAPAYGQNVPAYGQNVPAYGQVAPNFGQAAPTAVQMTHQHNLNYANSAQALAHLPTDIWTCPSNDATLPSSQAEREAWVEKLVDAICNVQNVEDKVDNSFKVSWFDPTTGVLSNHYSMEDKEEVAWKILDLAVNLHGYNSSVLHSLDQETLWKHAKATQTWTFKERMDRIIQLLTRSKGRCEMLLDDTGFHAVVGNPAAMLSALVMNTKENDRRQTNLTNSRANET